MSMSNSVFVHNTDTIKIKRSLAGEGQTKDTWDITITDKEGQSVSIYCWGDDAILTADLTGESV